jgi:Winged helix DNA-binding domain
MARVLTQRELNRATLARQLLLERTKLSPLAAIERVVGMQAQWPPSPYIGLWSRLVGFKRETLERAVQRGDVLKPTVMRGTLHLITARDYPLFYAAFKEMNTWFGPAHLERALAALPGVLAVLEDGRIAYDTILAHLRERHPELEETDWRRMVHAVRRHAHLLHSRETAVWTTRPSATYEQVPQPAPVDVAEARTEVVRRYLRAFGPATKADIADWSGLRVRDFDHALDGLPTYHSEAGKELFDVPRAPLPSPHTPAPIRFLPKWDNTLLAFVDRRRVISDELRRGVIGKNGDVAPTVLVDGVVAGKWSYDRKGVVSVEYLGPVTRTQKADVADEAGRLQEWLS